VRHRLTSADLVSMKSEIRDCWVPTARRGSRRYTSIQPPCAEALAADLEAWLHNLTVEFYAKRCLPKQWSIEQWMVFGSKCVLEFSEERSVKSPRSGEVDAVVRRIPTTLLGLQGRTRAQVCTLSA
jgi:hypothetical protein